MLRIFLWLSSWPPGHFTHASSTCHNRHSSVSWGHSSLKGLRATGNVATYTDARIVGSIAPFLGPQKFPARMIICTTQNDPTCRILYRTTSSAAGSVASNLHCVMASAVARMVSFTPVVAPPEMKHRASTRFLRSLLTLIYWYKQQTTIIMCSTHGRLKSMHNVKQHNAHVSYECRRCSIETSLC